MIVAWLCWVPNLIWAEWYCIDRSKPQERTCLRTHTCAPESSVVRGEMVFANFCSACHGAQGEQGVTGSTKRTVDDLVAFIRNPTGAMPKLYPSPLDDAEVNAVATYVRDVLQAAPRRPGPP